MEKWENRVHDLHLKKSFLNELTAELVGGKEKKSRGGITFL